MIARRLGSVPSGALANLAAQGIPFLLLLLATPVLLHALGRETYGALVLFTMVPQVAGQLDLGLVTASTRAYAHYVAQDRPVEAKRVVGETSLLVAAWGLLLGSTLLLTSERVAELLKVAEIARANPGVFVVAAASVPIALINAVALMPLRAVEAYGRAARIQVAAGVIYWSTCTALAVGGASLLALVLLSTIVLAATTIVLLTMQHRPEDRSTAGMKRGNSSMDDGRSGAFVLKPFLGVSAGAFVAQTSSLATYHADKLLISALLSPAAAGAYAICTSVANKILLLVASGSTYTFPRTIRLSATGDTASVATTFVLVTRFALMVSTAIAVPLVALAHPFLRLWIGQEFADQYSLTMQLLVTAFAINASSVVASNVAIGIGEVRMPAIFGVVGGVVTVTALVVLAPRFGTEGAALAALLGMSQALVFNHLVSRRIGTSADASWPLVVRLIVVAVPIACITALLGRWVGHWPTLLAFGSLSTIAVIVAWSLTFGRHRESALITHLVQRLRPQ